VGESDDEGMKNVIEGPVKRDEINRENGGGSEKR